ncbi:MFS transporter [Pseudomonas lijiangensis]|uniref:MFS transporter n=1 Tax=Pseudomonas lijiangensis TaxID=2995658 RepID=A0ABX8HX35_9PSED|nr:MULTISPECIES: MFS transporter [Pseudomonas syringae group]MBX8499134.1 MFS transporter [Pseudomonas lijiangensis]MBX8504713.1 MFS transporter [Pseudomonas lijiangensis]MBX8518384.1 MFS transporter [Pseudomonas cichorii]MBX8539850.1 MFS transporter [Pseudomonas cichorii]MBX8548735.1 MFS transporter [Pseudomonas cichorii]
MTRYLPYWCYYLHQGMLTALMLQGVVGYFRHQGLDLASLSLLSLTFLPWVGKFLWAPWCERHSIALRGNRYLGSLVILQLCMAVTLLVLGFLAPEHSIYPIMAGLMLLALLSASHDIYADGITITTCDAASRPFANTAQVGGSYLGVVFGSFVFLYLAEGWGWRAGFIGMAAVSLLLLLPVGLLPASKAGTEPTRRPRLDLSSFTALWPALCLTAIYYLAMRGLMAVQTVLLLDQGLNLGDLGFVTALYGTVASAIGVFLGGWMARRFGAWHCLLPAMGIHAAIAVAAALGATLYNLTAWLALFALVNVAAAISFVTLYNLLMGVVRAHQPASDYALLQSVDAAIAMLGSMAALQVAHYLGYPALLTILSAIACLCLWPALRLRHRLERTSSTSSTSATPAQEVIHAHR